MQAQFKVPVTAAVRVDLKAQLPQLAQVYGQKTPSALIEWLITRAVQEAGERMVSPQTEKQEQ